MQSWNTRKEILPEVPTHLPIIVDPKKLVAHNARLSLPDITLMELSKKEEQL
jgi:hypothetical protein